MEVFVQLKQEEGWVVCRVFKKRITTMRKVSDHESPCWYEDQVSFMPDLDSPKQNSQSNLVYQLPYPCKKELDHLPYHLIPHEHFPQLPLLESPKLLQASATISSNSLATYGIDINHATTNMQSSSFSHEQEAQQPHEQNFHAAYGSNCNEQGVDQVTDWRVLDKFVASQLSQDDASKENSYGQNAANVFHASDNTSVLVRHSEKQEMVLENASVSTSSCQIELWK